MAQSSKNKNTFRASDILYDKDQLIDCRNPSPLWMHSVDRQDTKTAGNAWTAFAISLAILVVVVIAFISVLDKKQPDDRKQNTQQTALKPSHNN